MTGLEQNPYLLPLQPSLNSSIQQSVEDDYHRFSADGLPANLDAFLLEEYGLNLKTKYGPFEINNPWGKASGQLSMTAQQVSEDVEAGLGFVVLKTVIAEDALGDQSMEAWAIKEARMLAERIVGTSGEAGWTVSWKGRGWWQSFEAYLQLIREAQEIARDSGTLIVPSCKYHLPTPEEDFWKESEYEYTTKQILAAWQEHAPASNSNRMPLEKDFSPTLAGSDRATAQRKILEWMQTVPRLIRAAVGSASAENCPVVVGMKMFNALFDDDFQLQMLNTLHEPGPNRPDFFIYGNRLFDPNREFDGKQGIAYGGPDLSERNLNVMSQFQQRKIENPLAWSATGNIASGKMAMEYALRGASSFQVHTYFQLPAAEYSMHVGSKVQKALRELYFHPTTGLIVWMHHVATELGLPTQQINLTDLIGQGPKFSLRRK